MGSAVVSPTSRTQHCCDYVVNYQTLSTTKAEYFVMAEGAKGWMFAEAVWLFLRPMAVSVRVKECATVLHEDNKGPEALAQSSLSSGRSKHIGVSWHFIQGLVRMEEVKIMHVYSGWQNADILPKPPSVTLSKRH